MNNEVLKNHGIDYETGLKNCVGNPTFYKKILTMFLEDRCFSAAEEAFKNRDGKNLFSCMHELKGISGNVALTELYAAVSATVEQLRACGCEFTEDTQQLFDKVCISYHKACEGIELFLENG